MPHSEQLRSLRARIRELRAHFLPRTFSPTGTYTKRQIDRTLAFRLLAHAEIEWYLEEIVVDTANKVFQAWQQRAMVTRPLLSMVAYSESNLGTVPSNIPSGPTSDLDDRVETSKNRVTTYAKSKNNGIKEQDILKLLLPVGICESDIDQLWLSTTTSFGRSRGEAAHVSNQVYNQPDPRNELDIVNQIVEGLSQIDEILMMFQSL